MFTSSSVTFPTICPMNQVNFTSSSLPFTNTQPCTMFSNIMATVISTQTTPSLTASPFVSTVYRTQDETWNIKILVSCLVLSLCYPSGNLTENISLFISRHSQSLRVLFKSTSLQSSSKTPFNQSYQLIKKKIILILTKKSEVLIFLFIYIKQMFGVFLKKLIPFWNNKTRIGITPKIAKMCKN